MSTTIDRLKRKDEVHVSLQSRAVRLCLEEALAYLQQLHPHPERTRLGWKLLEVHEAMTTWESTGDMGSSAPEGQDQNA